MAKSSLMKRTLGSVLIVVTVVGGVLIHPCVYALLFATALAVMINEFYRMAMGKGNHLVVRTLMILLSVTFFLACVYIKARGFSFKYLLAAFPLFSAVIFSVLFDKQDLISRLTVQDLCFVLIYLLVPFAIVNLLMFDSNGNYSPYLFIAVMSLVWMNDVGGYVLGSTFGQRAKSHKLAPDISPKKSWAGVIGCISFTFLSAFAIFKTGIFQLPLWQWFAAAAIVVVFGIFGDLFESLIKRHYAQKDAGTILIGHGGLLDRFDGALFAIPAVTVFFLLTGVI